MARPRKVESEGELGNLARDYAQGLYMLHYGRKGAVMVRQRAPYKWMTFAQFSSQAPPSRGWMDVIGKMDSANERALVSRQKVVGFIEVDKEDFPRLRKEKPWRESRGFEIVLWPPVAPDPEAFRLLGKPGSSISEIRAAAKRIRRWGGRFRHDAEIARLIDQHSEQLRDAKKLPHYPRSARPGSENRRIQFLAKVIAGLSFGLSPLYATKKLSGLRVTKEDALGWGSLPTRYPFLKRPDFKTKGEKQ